MTHYLVTGGAGFIGSHLTTQLVEDGHTVRVLDNLCTGNMENLAHLEGRFEFLAGDVSNPDDVANAVQDVEVVFHEAALASVPLSVERPLEVHTACATGTLNVLNAARDAGVRRVVYAASSSAYGNKPEMPKQEAHPTEMLSPYAAAKYAGELYCEAFAHTYDLETVRLRYFNVFGSRQDPDSPYSAVIPLFISALLAGKQPTIFGDGTQSRDFVAVGNVVQANIKAAHAEGVSGNVYNVGTGHSLTLLSLLEELCKQTGMPFDPQFGPPRPGDVMHSWADISRTQADLGYDPTIDLATGLESTLAYYRSLVTDVGNPLKSTC